MPINPEKEARMRAAATSVGRPREAQSVSRSPRNAGDLDDFVSLESELAATTEKLAAFRVAFDKAQARALLAEQNLAASTTRVDELERALSRRRAPDVEEVTDLALRHGVVSIRILALRASRNGGRPYANNDRTPVDEATLIATRAALQEVIACRMSGTEASRTAEVLVAREMATMAAE